MGEASTVFSPLRVLRSMTRVLYLRSWRSTFAAATSMAAYISSSCSSTRMMWPFVRSVTSQVSGQGFAGFFFFAQDDFGVEGVDIHDLHRVADFLLGIGAQRVGYRHFAAGYGNAHSYHLTIVANKKQPEGMPLSMRVYLRFRYPSAWNMLAPYLEADRYSIAQNGVGEMSICDHFGNASLTIAGERGFAS